MHYTDARPDAPADLILGELGTHIREEGMNEAAIQSIPAGIEDAFMWYMGQERAAG